MIQSFVDVFRGGNLDEPIWKNNASYNNSYVNCYGCIIYYWQESPEKEG